MLTDTDRAYIAGFFDGEGCVYSGWRNNAPSVVLKFAQKDRVILDLILEKLKAGKVSQNRSNGNHMLVITGRENIRKVIKLIYPFAQIKKEQLRVAYVLTGLVSKKAGYAGRARAAATQSRRLELHNQLSALKRVQYVG